MLLRYSRAVVCSSQARLCCCDIQGQWSVVVMPASVVAIFKDSSNSRLCCCDIQGQWSVVVMPASVVAIFKDSGVQGQWSLVVMPTSVVAIFKDSGNVRLCYCDIQGQW